MGLQTSTSFSCAAGVAGLNRAKARTLRLTSWTAGVDPHPVGLQLSHLLLSFQAMSSVIEFAAAARAMESWLNQHDWQSPAHQQMMRAILADDAKAVATAVDAGAPVEGVTPLDRNIEFVLAGPSARTLTWLSHAVSEQKSHATRALLSAGADPLQVFDKNEDGSLNLVVLQSFVLGDAATVAVFKDWLPLSPVYPLDEWGYGPLAAALAPVCEHALNADAGHPHLAIIDDLLGCGQSLTWDEASRKAVWMGAVGSTLADIQSRFEKINLRLSDLSEVGRQEVLAQALLTRSLLGKRRPHQDNGWLEALAELNTPLLPATHHESFDEINARQRYISLRDCLHPPSPVPRRSVRP
jgi:hypothetical protein